MKTMSGQVGGAGGLIRRRDFLVQVGAGGAALVCDAHSVSGAEAVAAPRKLPTPRASKLPRWRGFNLLEKFTKQAGGNPAYREEDFAWVAEWGFDFVRLPMSYLCWTDPADWTVLREPELKHIDEAIAFGQRYGVHVNLNFHRAPGYCVNPPAERLDLFADEKALEVCGLHWRAFARRFRGIPNDRLSFDLLNEPKDLPEADYARVVRRLVEEIRAEDPDRLIIADGLRWGNKPAQALIGLGVAQSTRGYAPMRVSHHKASWVNGQNWSEPSWPLKLDNGEVWDKERLRREQIVPWQDLEQKGVGVHVGEWGAFNHTPHPVVMAWMRDCLDLWNSAGWGWALWNLRGSFGVVDSQRADTKYDAFHGHQLDREMLEVLRGG